MLLLLLISSAAWAQHRKNDTVPLDPALPCQARRSSPVTYDVDFSIVVTPPYKTKLLRVWLPIPPSDGAQEVSDNRFSSFPLAVEPMVDSAPVYGNKFACFEFKSPQGAQIIRHRFRVKVWELRWDVEIRSPKRFLAGQFRTRPVEAAGSLQRLSQLLRLARSRFGSWHCTRLIVTTARAMTQRFKGPPPPMPAIAFLPIASCR